MTHRPPSGRPRFRGSAGDGVVAVRGVIPGDDAGADRAAMEGRYDGVLG